MKPIKITEANRAALEAVLAEVNGKATTHAFTTFEQLYLLANDAECKLHFGFEIPATRRAGASLQAVSGEPVAAKYRSGRAGTAVTLERKPSGWYLECCSAVTLYPDHGGKRVLTLTSAQDEEIVRRVRQGYRVAA